MFGKKAKLRKELDERLTNPLSSFSSDSSFSDILAPNLDFSLHFYNSHRKKITNTPNKVEKLSEDTISKIKEVFHVNKSGQKTDENWEEVKRAWSILFFSKRSMYLTVISK